MHARIAEGSSPRVHTFPFPLAWYPWTGNPPLSSQFQNHPLLQILLLTIGLSLSFVSSVNFLKSIFTPFSLCLAISSHPSSLVSSLNAQLPLLCSFLLTPFFLSLNLMFLSVVSFLISKRLSILFLTNLFLTYFLHSAALLIRIHSYLLTSSVKLDSLLFS